MDASFDRTCAIIDLEPTAKPLSYASGRQWLLWPTWAYRVIVPQPKPERLNLFQRSVLSLCRAGIVHAGEIAQRLNFDKELAAYILNQLEGMGLLDRSKQLTERANQLLAEEPDDQVEPVVGYVFADPFAKELWPRFQRGVLPYAEGEIRGRSATIKQGTVGDPRPIEPRVVWPPKKRMSAPSRRDILRSCLMGIRAEVAYKRAMGTDNGTSDGLNVDTLKRHLNRVVLVDTAPEPMFLTTFVFVPKDVRRSSLWQVCDPFGLGTSQRLRKRIEKLVSESSQAGATLKDAIERATGMGFEVEDVDVLDLVRARNQEAAEVVDDKADFDKTICPEVYEQLVQMENEHLEAGNGDISGKAWDEQQRRLKAMVRRAYEVLEECLAYAVKTFPASDIGRPLGGTLEDNGVLLAEIARQIGFEDDPDDRCFERFLRIGGGPVKGVVEYEQRELVALLAATLLVAHDRSEHSLRRCAAEFPKLIVFLNQLKRMRDQSSHHTQTQDDLDREEALGFRKDTYRAARLLLPIAESGTTGSRSQSSAAEWSADLVYRLRAQAAYNVESEFGIRVREVPALHDELVEVEFLSLELAKLRSAGATQEEMDGRAKDLRIACGNAVEAAVAPLLTQADVSEFITSDRNANAERYSKTARDLGFTSMSDGQYHKDLLMVHPDRARSAAETQRGALNALLIVALLQAEQDIDHPLRKIKKKNPRFLLDTGEISQARGHGDGRNRETIGPEVLKKHVVAIGKAVLDILT